MSSDNDSLVLTNKRVRYDESVWGQSKLIGITLDSIASCGLVTKSYPWLLVLAVIALLAALNQNGPTQGAFLGAGVALIIVYFVSRKAVISIASSGGQEIVVPAKGMKREAIVKFIESVEREKLLYAR